MPELELRAAALGAHAYLRIAAARQYGLIAGGPEIKVERCEEVIGWATKAGMTFTDEEIDEALIDVLAWHAASDEERAEALGCADAR